MPVLRLTNPGYGAAANAGVAALEPATEAVFIVNPDVLVRPGAVSALESALAANPRIGVVGPRIDDVDGSRYPSARRFPSFVDGAGHAIVGLFKPDNRWSRRYKMTDVGEVGAGLVDWVSGAALFVRKQAFDAVGGFDPRYFMYMEDVDLCFRMHKAGWNAAYEPAASVMHVQGVSTRQRAYRMIYIHHRSLIRYHARNTTGVDRLLLPVVLFGLAVRLPIALLQRYSTSRASKVRTGVDD